MVQKTCTFPSLAIGADTILVILKYEWLVKRGFLDGAYPWAVMSRKRMTCCRFDKIIIGAFHWVRIRGRGLL